MNLLLTFKRYKKIAGFYFFPPYNARLAAAYAALVHRFRPISRVLAKRACLKNSTSFRIADSLGFPVSNDVFCAG